MSDAELIELNEAIKILLAKKERIEADISNGERFNEVDYKLPQAIIRVLNELSKYRRGSEYDTKLAYKKGFYDGFKQAKFDIEMDNINEGEE